MSLDSDSAYILKAKKFAGPLFQSKKFAEKVHKSGHHFWAIWGNFGSFLGIFGHFIENFADNLRKIQIFSGPIGAMGARF